MNFHEIEALCREHQFTIAAMTAIATLMAVITSLLIAWASARANRTKLRAFVDLVQVVANDIPADNRPRYLSVSITNIGTLALHLEFSFFAWKIPFDSGYAVITPLDYYGVDEFHPVVRYPVEISPRTSHRACLSDFATFSAGIASLAASLKWARRLRLRYQRAIVFTSDGERFPARISSSVRRELNRIASLT